MGFMAVMMIGVDPHKASHTAVVINAAEEPLGQLRVRASAVQAERLLEWAQAWPERAWAVEGAGGLGHLLAQQLLSAGERVLDVPPKLAARVRLLATGNINKNDPNDARSVAIAALRSAGIREARRDDHAAVLKVWSKRYRDLGRARTQVACRLHQVLCELVPGGVPGEITAGQARQVLASVTPAGAVDAARWELAAELTEDLRGIDARIRETRKKAAAAVRAAGASLTGLFGVGPVIAAAVSHGDHDVTEGDQLTLEVRRDCDREYLRRASAFIRAKAGQGVPFFVYFNHSLMHMPVIPREEFKGQTGHGDWADSLLELDTDFGTLLDLLDELDLAGSTLVVFAGDNGPEEVMLWRGTPGYWEGSYFAGGEGNLRTPCIVRWPGHIPGGQVSDDIMHVTDWFTTLVRAAGAQEPADRVIDGVNQLAWLTGQRSSSLREGYLYWMGPELYGVKWRNFKLAFVAQQYSTDPVGKLSSPRIINLVADPHEREPLDLPYMHSWTVTHFNRLLGEFQASVDREPPVPPGAPLDFVPSKAQQGTQQPGSG
jgi:Transposase/Sulfatase